MKALYSYFVHVRNHLQLISKTSKQRQAIVSNALAGEVQYYHVGKSNQN